MGMHTCYIVWFRTDRGMEYYNDEKELVSDSGSATKFSTYTDANYILEYEMRKYETVFSGFYKIYDSGVYGLSVNIW